MNWSKKYNHNHCQWCGKALRESDPYVDRYDEKTGEPIFRTMLTCPRWAWWKLTHHFRQEFEGSEMIIDMDFI